MIARRSFAARLLAAPAALLAAPAVARAQTRQGPPHEWIFGAWTGGVFPPLDTEGPGCFGAAIVIFTRDIVMRATSLEIPYRQRLIETVAQTPDGLEFRLIPLPVPGGPLAAARIPEAGFGCDGNPNLLRVVRRGADEIAFPGCIEFPAVLRRCRTVG